MDDFFLGDSGGIGFTSFQADSMSSVNLDPGKSTVLRFRFNVPGSVADGAFFAAEIFVGENPNPRFDPIGFKFVCCFVKGMNGPTSLSEKEMHAWLQHLQIPGMAPAEALSPQEIASIRSTQAQSINIASQWVFH